MGIANAAKTHCPAGHVYDEANTYVAPDGRRYCRSCRRGVTRRYRKAHPDRVRAKNRRYYRADPERQRRWERAWIAANRARQRERVRRGLHAHRGVPLDEDAKEWAEVILLDPCSLCGSRDRVTLDHIDPVDLGGDSRWENLAPLCKSCNSGKKNRSLLRQLVRIAA